MIKSPVLPVNDTAVGANDDDTQTPEAAVLLPPPPPPGVARRDLPDGPAWSPLQMQGTGFHLQEAELVTTTPHSDTRATVSRVATVPTVLPGE